MQEVKDSITTLMILDRLILNPAQKALRAILDYAEIDDPETAAERLAFDAIEHKMLAGHIASEEAKKQGINRRGILNQSIFGGQAISARDRDLLARAQEAARNAKLTYSVKK